ncbi:hypothetical protein OF376_01715 [Ureaplasma miroungigenitalium]|uniref:Uncharacterized protein n=1 Tax=Ureaplasma miroungigenitalium TaxID=1042321 RepID=A0ABT3BMV3_9BACT|nr:hypothetical protein [Ureaplasma miroungigenitalium]MCV3728482.1 hypothetical protein [Ureaplasma miroungigenitalium]MCV3734269.1 hypothetical protein [Ureaplasma miroungigenitalium]
MSQKIYINLSYPEQDKGKYISSLPIILDTKTNTKHILEYLKLKYNKQKVDLFDNVLTFQFEQLYLHVYIPTTEEKPNIFDQQSPATHIKEFEHFDLKSTNTPWLFYETNYIKKLHALLCEVLERFVDYVSFVDFWAVHMHINSWVVFSNYDFRDIYVKNPDYLKEIFYTKKNDVVGYTFIMHLRAYGFINLGFENDYFDANQKEIYNFIRQLVAADDQTVATLYKDWQTKHQTTKIKNKEELFLVTKH